MDDGSTKARSQESTITADIWDYRIIWNTFRIRENVAKAPDMGGIGGSQEFLTYFILKNK
jgi:hypothetical protein